MTPANFDVRFTPESSRGKTIGRAGAHGQFTMKSRRRIALPLGLGTASTTAYMPRLQQGFTTGEMALSLKVARQQSRSTDVALGSKADVTLLNFDVRFTPASGHPT
jgi:hypothetical protein